MITVEKAKKLRAIIERAAAALELDNEAALECVELFPAWEDGKTYLCIREDATTGTALYYTIVSLLGNYFEAVTA